jgi:bacterioferritin (cytochrome b1)
MTATPTTNQAWIVSELVRLLSAERSMSENARARAETPPDPSLGVVYHEIAAADLQHAAVIETIATRYGHTPSRDASGGIGDALGRFRDKMVGLGTNAIDLLAADATAKAAVILWYRAWVHTFEAIGDAESSAALAAVLVAEETHLDALQHSLIRLVEQGAGLTAALAK